MLLSQIAPSEITTWTGVAVTALFVANTAWNSWLTYRNRKLDFEVRQHNTDAQHRDKITDSRVDQIWKSNYERGVISAKQRPDLLIGPDPIRQISHAGSYQTMLLDPKSIPVEVKDAYSPIIPFLKQLRLECADPARFSELLDKELGTWILRHICEPLRIVDYECMAIARAIAEEAVNGSKFDLKALPKST